MWRIGRWKITEESARTRSGQSLFIPLRQPHSFRISTVCAGLFALRQSIETNPYNPLYKSLTMYVTRTLGDGYRTIAINCFKNGLARHWTRWRVVVYLVERETSRHCYFFLSEMSIFQIPTTSNTEKESNVWYDTHCFFLYWRDTKISSVFVLSVHFVCYVTWTKIIKTTQQHTHTLIHTFGNIVQMKKVFVF